ncbi:MAG: hypothetical protein ACOCZK_01700 [Planctomycetota bacterium]
MTVLLTVTLLGLVAVEAPPPPGPLTPFGLLGDAQPYRPAPEHYAWISYLQGTARDRTDSDTDYNVWELRAGAGGPLAASAPSTRDWQVDYTATAGWRVHQDGSYDSADMFLTHGSFAPSAALSLSRSWGVAARADLRFGDSRDGRVRFAPAGSAALVHDSGDRALLLGVSYATLTGDAITEKRLLPLIEFHAIHGPGLRMVLGFPRTELYWSPRPSSDISVRYRFPYDAEFRLAQELGVQLGLELRGWNHARAWAGWSESERFYVQERGVALMLGYRRETWRIQAGPALSFREEWHVGARRDTAERIASVDEGLGLLLTGAVRF